MPQDNLEGWDGMGVCGVCILTADSCSYMAETIKILQSNYPPNKNIFKKNKKKWALGE